MRFGQNVHIGAGCKISCAENGTIVFGNGTTVNVNSKIICMQEIVFGENCMLSWDDLIMDSDFHSIEIRGTEKPHTKPIVIGNDVWVGCGVSILKGTIIPDGSILAANSNITRCYYERNCVIGTDGVLQTNVRWKR